MRYKSKLQIQHVVSNAVSQCTAARVDRTMYAEQCKVGLYFCLPQKGMELEQEWPFPAIF